MSNVKPAAASGDLAERPLCDVVWLGRIGYVEAWEMQRQLAARRLAGEISDTLLLLEHSPTITVGRSTRENHIVASSEMLNRMGVTVVETDRGGDVTYHGPGQLVGYPILNLSAAPHKPDLHHYLRQLEEALIHAVAVHGVAATRFPGYTGVWVGEDEHREKVAAIGIKTSRWITMHGFAYNIEPNLSHFDLIVPCGIRTHGVTSLSKVLGRRIAVADAIPAVTEAFGEIFGLECRMTDGLI